MNTKSIIVVLVALLAWVACARALPSLAEEADPNGIVIDIEPHWSLEFGIGFRDGDVGDLIQGLAFYWPDYQGDGGIGVMVLGGDAMDQRWALGPAVEFPLGEVYHAVLSTILPNDMATGLARLTAPVRPTGMAGLPFDEDSNPIAVGGTSFHVWPNRHIQPTVRTQYIRPSGNSRHSRIEGLWTFFDLVIFF